VSPDRGLSAGERRLVDRVDRLVADAEPTLGVEFRVPNSGTTDLEARGHLLAALTVAGLNELRQLEPGDDQLPAICDLALRAADLEVELRELDLQRRKRALVGIEAALGRFRCMKTTAELVDSVCLELVRSCGFSRAMISRVEDHTWRPWKAYFEHREVRPEDNAWMADTRIPLSSMILERELLESQRAAFVVDASSDERALGPFVSDTRATSYVAAPVIPAGNVVGFLHADHYPSGRRVDRVDRDLLQAFAENFGQIYERTALMERLTAQRDHVRETLRAAESIMDTLARSELELARHEDERSIATGAATLALAAERTSMDELLTPREREVLSLIVVGQSNGTIAERLVISEGTVKSHVKQILRKVGAANRSEAIARYLGMVGAP
jgi:DNA-binding CsgD family transcriptional regulator